MEIIDNSFVKLVNQTEYQFLEKFVNDDKFIQNFSSKKRISTDEINFLLINNGKNNLHYQTHALIIKFMLEELLKRQKITNKIKFDFYNHIQKDVEKNFQKLDLKNISSNRIIDIMEYLHYEYLNSEYILDERHLSKKRSKINLRDKGAVYTPNEIAHKIVKKTIDAYFKKTNNFDATILDFGCGTGIFFFAALKYLKKLTKKSFENIISENLFAIDSDPIAIAILTIKSCLISENFSNDFFTLLSKRLVCENMLHVHDPTKLDIGGMDYEKKFSSVFKKNGFDIIISNPPYFILKGTGNKKGLKIFYEHQLQLIKEEANYFHQNGFYTSSIQGMLNYYRLSIECMLKISNENGVLGVICPATLFGDVSASHLRKELLETNQIVFLEYFPEKSKLFKHVAQATSIFILNKNKMTDKIELKNNLIDDKIHLDLKLISEVFSNLEIPFISKEEWQILKKLTKFKKIHQIQKLRNRRGELDLSLLKKCISRKKTDYSLIRGNDIRENQINKGPEFVQIEKFLKVKSNEYVKNDFEKIRIAGQQISNIDAVKRLKFAITEPNFILGNSCNYITVDESIDVNWILAQLNSYLLNWRFKITSSNNHVNNYELDELPIIGKKPKKFNDDLNELQKNILVCNSFGLNLIEIKKILKNHFNDADIVHNYGNMCD